MTAMKIGQVLAKLKSLGSAQTRKTYVRHGLVGPMFGVKFGDLNKLTRSLKGDHELALELWESGNFDARILATMIADTEQITMKTLQAWMRDVQDIGLSNALSNVAQRSRAAATLMRKWMMARHELVAATAWMMLAGIARERPEILTKVEYRKHLKTIEAKVHGERNRVKYSMNAALIGIGSYVMEKEAVAIAKRLGEIDVDHGDTSCQTPSAAGYIRKSVTHQREVAARRAAKRSAKKKAKKD